MFRRSEAARRGVGALTIALAAFGVFALAASNIQSRRLVWNSSASAPIGLYWRIGGEPDRGDLVLAWAPDWARKLAAERSYLPMAVPLVKRVAAVEGDQICAAERSVTVNNAAVALRLELDGKGRQLPHWSGCRELRQRQFLLLMGDVPDSFDGRYFGVTEAQDIIGRLVPLWVH